MASRGEKSLSYVDSYGFVENERRPTKFGPLRNVTVLVLAWSLVPDAVSK